MVSDRGGQKIDSGPTIAERKHDLITFYRHYETLVEILVEAHQASNSVNLEKRFDESRKLVEASYGRVRPYVIAYLRYSTEDAAQGLRWLGRSTDAFEALTAAPTLADLVRSDHGDSITRIDRTRTALNLYGDHLRRLSQSSQ